MRKSSTGRCLCWPGIDSRWCGSPLSRWLGKLEGPGGFVVAVRWRRLVSSSYRAQAPLRAAQARKSLQLLGASLTAAACRLAWPGWGFFFLREKNLGSGVLASGWPGWGRVSHSSRGRPFARDLTAG